MALSGWSYMSPLLARMTVRWSLVTFQTTPTRGWRLSRSFAKLCEAASGALALASGGEGRSYRTPYSSFTFGVSRQSSWRNSASMFVL